MNLASGKFLEVQLVSIFANGIVLKRSLVGECGLMWSNVTCVLLISDDHKIFGITAHKRSLG